MFGLWIFLHDFTLFVIDMNYIYHILSFATTFGALSNMTFLGQKCIPILGMRLTWFQCLKKLLLVPMGPRSAIFGPDDLHPMY